MDGTVTVTATPAAISTPTPQPGLLSQVESPPALLPATADSLFQSCQIVAFYGYPGNRFLGVLGEFAQPDELAARLRAVEKEYDEANGPRHAVGALHLIAAVAQADAGPDGTYVSRMPKDLIEQYIALAEQHDFLVFLDLQIGWSTVAAEVDAVKPYLENPRVHLALDPEWTMPPGVPPGAEIGRMYASDINHAQEVLKDVVDEHHLPKKILIVHQFTESMIVDKPTLIRTDGVDLVIDMDGFGGRQIKLDHYHRFVGEDGAPHGGLKLFIDEDTDIFRPAEVQEIVPQPDYIQYQ